jgi:hypothetical protein
MSQRTVSSVVKYVEDATFYNVSIGPVHSPHMLKTNMHIGLFHGSGGWSQASHRGGLGQSMWNLCWTKRHWDMLSPSSLDFPIQFYSTIALYIHITWGMISRPSGGCSSQT